MTRKSLLTKPAELGSADYKQCFKCGVAKPTSEFYRHPMMADGHLGKCKECAKSDTRSNYRETIQIRKAYEKLRFQQPGRKSAVLRYQQESRLRHPEKYAARNAVANAVRAGQLKKQACKCGDTKVQAHHHDYNKPLDVEWLCFRCHRNDVTVSASRTDHRYPHHTASVVSMAAGAFRFSCNHSENRKCMSIRGNVGFILWTKELAHRLRL